MDHFKPGLGDVVIVLAFTGLRWEEAVAVLVGHVDLASQCMTIDRTASESGGRRDIRDDMKSRAAVRTVMIPDIAMSAVRRLLARGAEGRERSGGTLFARLINGDRGGYCPTRCGAATFGWPRAIPLLTRTGSSATPHTSCATSARPCSSPPGPPTCR